MIRREKRSYEFGPFQIDTEERLLTRGGEVVPLPPKAVDTLLALVANSGRILTNDELMKVVWPDTNVEEGGLPRNISQLRKVLGRQSIRNFPKLGYRLVLPVKPKAEEQTPEETAQRYGLAVLPLKMLYNDPAQQPFVEGMNEALITNLAKVSALRVYQAMPGGLADLASAGKVEAGVEGACLLDGRHVRITVRLIRAKTGEHMWAEEYQRELRDIVELQGRVAADVARQVQVRITLQEYARLDRAQPVNPAAYQAYLEGRFWWNRRTIDGFSRAIDSFKLAIATDPHDARAYSGLADTYALLGSTPYYAKPPKDLFPEAAELAQKALAIDSSLAEAHASLAFVKQQFEWDTAGAEREFRQAIELNPGYATAHHWYGHNLLTMGRLDEALAEKTRAQELDSRSLIIASSVGWRHYFAGEYDRAIEQCQRALERDPNFVVLLCILGLAYAESGRSAEAVGAFEKAQGLAPTSPSVMAGLGRAHAVSGHSKAARALLAKLRALSEKQYVPAMLFAFMYTSLQEKDAAFEWLEKAREERSDYMLYLKIDPAFACLRSDARFASLIPNA